MAKKKPNNQTQETMEDSQKLVDSLKSLNAMLLKETAERRQQIDSLVQSKGSLESQLNESVSENALLQSEKNVLNDAAALLEIEKHLVSVFVMSQVEEKNAKEAEIAGLKNKLEQLLVKVDEEKSVSARACAERDEIKKLLDARIREVDQLSLKVAEAEKNEARIMKQVKELKANVDGLNDENVSNKKRIESLTKERDLIRKDLDESNRLVNDLERSIDQLRQEKKAVEDEKSTQERKNDELQTSVGELERLVESMKIEEEMLSNKFADLEKKYVTICNNEAELQKEIEVLIEQKKGTEERIVSLDNEKSLITKDLEDARTELEQQKLRIEQIVHEKTELQSAKIQGDTEIIKLNEQLRVSEDKISSLEMSSANQVEKIMQLEGEVSTYRAANDQAIIERDEALESLDTEKSITSDIKEKITIMEQEIEDLRKEVANLTTEIGEHLGEKKELETQCEKLVKDVASLETELSETCMEFDDTKGKLGVAEANSKRVLMVLKKTLSVCDEDDEENGVEEGIKDHVTEVKAIKRAFKDKESRLEQMKRQLELIKRSAAEARKRKSFWTMVSSATTLLAAAASFAYVARAH